MNNNDSRTDDPFVKKAIAVCFVVFIAIILYGAFFVHTNISTHSPATYVAPAPGQGIYLDQKQIQCLIYDANLKKGYPQEDCSIP